MPLTPVADPSVPDGWHVPQAQGQPIGDPSRQRSGRPEHVHWPEPGEGPGRGELRADAHTGPHADAHTDPHATGQWNFADAERPAPATDVTGQWTIPVARASCPRSRASSPRRCCSPSGAAHPATLPGGAPAPWATDAPATLPGGAARALGRRPGEPRTTSARPNREPAEPSTVEDTPVEHATAGGGRRSPRADEPRADGTLGRRDTVPERGPPRPAAAEPIAEPSLLHRQRGAPRRPPTSCGSTAPTGPSPTPGSASPCSTCCASASASPAPRTAARRASAAPATSRSTAGSSPPAWCPPATAAGIRGPYGRGPRRRRRTVRRPARPRRVRRRAVRLLHPRHGHDRPRPAGGQPRPHRAGDPPGALRQPLPLLRLSRRARRREGGRRRTRSRARQPLRTASEEARIPHQAPPGAGSVQAHPHDGGMA